MYQIAPRITKQYLFDRIPQEQIMEYYLGLPVKLGAKYVSPLRKDTYPTCNYWYASTGELLFKDHSGAFTGNCIQVVREMFGVNYPQALEQIASDFGLTATENESVPSIREFTTKPKPDKSRAEFTFSFRQWTTEDLAYWASFGITTDTLDKFKVSVISTAWLGDTIVYNYNPKDPCFVYGFGDEEYKLYFPLRSRQYTRFLGNSARVQGYTQLPASGKLLVMTKSLKDVMALWELGVISIALQGESIVPSKELISEMKSRFETIYTLYDFDLAGIQTANKIKKLYGVQPIFLTNGRFGTKNQRAKDTSELIEEVGFAQVQNFVNNLKTTNALW